MAKESKEGQRNPATREALRALAAAPPEVVYEPDATPAGGLWLRRMTPKAVRLARQKAKVVGSDDEIVTDLDLHSRLTLALSIVSGPEPEAQPLYGTGEDELLALEDEIPEGYRIRLLNLAYALQGFESGRERLDFLRQAGNSTSGVCTASAPAPATSPSPSSDNSGKTTGS